MKLVSKLYNWTGALAILGVVCFVLYLLFKWSNLTYFEILMDFLYNSLFSITFFLLTVTCFYYISVKVDEYEKEEKAKRDQFEFEEKKE